MNTKLTLTIESEIISKAKEYAKGKNRSLSDIIENYLTNEDQKQKGKSFNPVVKSLKRAFKTSNEMDYKKELEKRLGDKYL
jgi:glutamyl-tRNA reductase